MPELRLLATFGLPGLGLALVACTMLHSAMLWRGFPQEKGLGHLLAAHALQGLGLLACLACPWPESIPAGANLLLLLGAGYGLWALRTYAGLPARMNLWGWTALGAWTALALAFHAMGFKWVRGLALPVTLAVLALGISREWGRLPRPGSFRAPAQAGAVLAALLALGALVAGLTAAVFLNEPGADSGQARAWLFLALLGLHQGATILLAQTQAQRVQARLAGLAGTDPDTGLASARGFRERLNRAVDRSLRTGRVTSILVLELDRYEEMVQAHGSAQVARIQEAFAVTLNATLREADFSGFLGGGRFAALLHQTPPGEALLAAERLRSTWENAALSLDALPIRATLSGGVASTRETVADAEELLTLAMGRAWAVRSGGGNNVDGEVLYSLEAN